MEIKELKQKSKEELQNLLKDARIKIADKKILLAEKKLKNFKEVGELRKDIARILTLLKQ